MPGNDINTKLFCKFYNNLVDESVGRTLSRTTTATNSGVTFSSTVRKNNLYNPYSAYFNGSSYCYFPSHTDFDLGSTFTIDCNFYMTSYGGSGGYVLFNRTLGSSPYTGYYLAIRQSDHLPYFAYSNNTCIFSNTAVNLNTWYNIAIIYTGGILTMKLNGNTVASSAVTCQSGSGYNLTIGYFGTPAIGAYMYGYIDYLRISNVVRTDINPLFNLSNVNGVINGISI